MIVCVGAMIDICLIGGAMNGSSMKVVNSDRLDEIKEITLPVSVARGASVAIGQHLFYLGGTDAESVDQPLPRTLNIDFRHGMATKGSPER